MNAGREFIIMSSQHSQQESAKLYWTGVWSWKIFSSNQLEVEDNQLELYLIFRINKENQGDIYDGNKS